VTSSFETLSRKSMTISICTN